MTVDDKTKDKKLSYNINRGATQMILLVSAILANMNIKWSNKFYLLIKVELQNIIHSPLEKSIGKQTSQGQNQIKALKN